MSLINWGRGSAVDLPEGEMSFQLMEGSGFPLAWHIRETLEPSFTTRSLERLMIFGGTGETEIKGKFNEGPYWSSEQSFLWHLDIVWLDWSTRCVCKSQIPRSPENSTFRPSCFLLKQTGASLYLPRAFEGDRNKATISWSPRLELDTGLGGWEGSRTPLWHHKGIFPEDLMRGSWYTFLKML